MPGPARQLGEQGVGQALRISDDVAREAAGGSCCPGRDPQARRPGALGRLAPLPPSAPAAAPGAARRHVVERLADRHAGAAVDRGVVDLGVDRDLAVVQAGDDVELPERPRAVERRAAGRSAPRPARSARRGQRRAQMVVEVELAGIDPARMVEVEHGRRASFRRSGDVRGWKNAGSDRRRCPRNPAAS